MVHYFQVYEQCISQVHRQCIIKQMAHHYQVYHQYINLVYQRYISQVYQLLKIDIGYIY